MRTEELVIQYCDNIPENISQGTFYISEKYETAIHLCACGCGIQTATPFKEGGWNITMKEGKVTLRPSIGNFKGQSPYHAHYYITNNKIEWL